MNSTYLVTCLIDNGTCGTLSYGLLSKNNLNIVFASNIRTVTLTGPITVDVPSSVIVDGGRGVTIIAGSSFSGGNYLISDSINSPTKVTFKNIIFNGNAVAGGINVNNGDYVLENCIIKNCIGTNGNDGTGGGVNTYGCGMIKLNYCTISRCVGGAGGGGNFIFGNGGAGGVNTNNNGTVQLNYCTISNCVGGAGGNGGLICGNGGAGGVNTNNNGTVQLTNCTISNCVGGNGSSGGSGGAGGINVVGNCKYIVINCTISANIAGTGTNTVADGIYLYNVQSTSVFTIGNTIVSGNGTTNFSTFNSSKALNDIGYNFVPNASSYFSATSDITNIPSANLIVLYRYYLY